VTSDLTADDFPAFFESVHGVPPFPWQKRLLRDWVARPKGWPSVLDLPTGSGKTAALDIAVFHLALEAQNGQARRAPIRIAFVVDRRLIVDDAFARAKKLERILGSPETDIVNRVVAALRSLAGGKEPPLLARRLRGGAPREDDWARTPVQPTILCSTVDQIGSRLLFRGYGVSDRMKPIHAGLLGSDCLILLDEAHLAEPFRQTLASIERWREKNGSLTPWHVAQLSATPGHQSQTSCAPEQAPFSLDDDDRANPVLARRLSAAKPAILVEIAGQQGVPAETRRIEEIANRTIRALEVLGRDLQNPAIGVVVNRVARARQVFEQLQGQLSDTRVVLIIGPARPVDREEMAIRDLQPIRTGEKRTLESPLIVVATQTVEAGVDIDFDGLVTEAAALDALRQRFGRLNRAGRNITPAATILVHRDDIGNRAVDPVYGDRITKTWEALNAVAAGSPEPIVEFGIAGFPHQLTENSHELAAEKKNAPILLPAYVDLWSQTSPTPSADPEVALFLHGPERSPASVQIIWRADASDEDFNHRDRSAALLDLVPPRSGETIEIPLWTARAWLREEVSVQAALSDTAERAPEEIRERHGRRSFRYAGSDDERRTRAVFAEELSDGDLIVVPASYGGCDQWGWAPSSTGRVMDQAEKAAEPYASRRFAVRVTPELMHQWLVDEVPEDGREPATTIDALRESLRAVLAEHRDDAAPGLLDTVLDLPRLPAMMRGWLERLKDRNGRLERIFAHGYDTGDRPRGVVFLAPRGIKTLGSASVPDHQTGIPATEDDALGSTPGYSQSLDDHSCDVRDRAIEFSTNALVKAEIAEDVALAAYLHDVGKADPRFQAMLYGGDWFAVDDAKVLAKSPQQMPLAWEKAGLPKHWRHEALSVRIARAHARFGEAHDPELVLWLIGVHHGYGRPFFPHADESAPERLPDVLGGLKAERGPGPQSLEFRINGWDWPQIFERLKHRYGVWELAKLEAIVRLADHRASEAPRHGFARGDAT
jgi:CRISPR-associated endonuclease/helicase Cas3